MREIEIKARVRNSKVLLVRLAESGIILGEPLKQHDVVYLQPGVQSGAKDTVGLRVRTENDKIVHFTLKKILGGGLDKLEHEVEVDDGEELTAIIRMLGFELFSDLTKVRRKAHQGDIEICYDEIPELGIFIEAERLCSEDADNVAVENELWRLFESFGVTKADQEVSGYDILMDEQKRKR